MPKRRCPFSDCMPQLKQRLREIDVYKTNPDYLNDIYDKTLQKLFKAPKDMCNNNSNPPQPTQTALSSCDCDKSETSTDNTCSYCDKLLCINCLNVCNLCEKIFCDGCSTMVYEDADTSVLCYNCI